MVKLFDICRSKVVKTPRRPKDFYEGINQSPNININRTQNQLKLHTQLNIPNLHKLSKCERNRITNCENKYLLPISAELGLHNHMTHAMLERAKGTALEADCAAFTTQNLSKYMRMDRRDYGLLGTHFSKRSVNDFYEKTSIEKRIYQACILA